MHKKILALLVLSFTALGVGTSLTVKKIDVIQNNTGSTVDIQAPLESDSLKFAGATTVDTIDTDTTLTADSDTRLATQRAIKAYVDASAGGGGDVVGPASSTDNALARFDLATGKLIQNSVGILDDTGNLTGLNNLTATGLITGGTLTLTTGATVSELSIDGTLAGDSDTAIPTEKAVKTYVDSQVPGAQDFQSVYNASTPFSVTYNGTNNGMILTDNATPIGSDLLLVQSNAAAKFFGVDVNGISLSTGATINEFSTDTTLSGDSDTAVPTERAVKAYVDANAGGSGDFVGPGASTDNAIVRFDGATGKLGQNSGVLINDSSVITSSGHTINGRLEVNSTTLPSRPCPTMTDIQRDALTPAAGDCAFVTDTAKLLYYDGSQWVEFTTSPAPSPAINAFSADIYTGNGGSQSIATSDAVLDCVTNNCLTWVKRRDSSDNSYLFDGSRGANNHLSTNLNTAEGTTASSLTWTSTGFTVGGGLNLNVAAATYAAWTFMESSNFLDIVEYTGTGAVQNIAHNLGVTPEYIIVKRKDSTGNWTVYSNSASMGAGNKLVINSTNGVVADSAAWNNTAPTTTQFTVGTSSDTNFNTGNFVAYVFGDSGGKVSVSELVPTGTNTVTPNPGKNILFAMFKRSSVGGTPFRIHDPKRVGGVNYTLNPTDTTSEDTVSGGITISGDTFNIAGYSGASDTFNVFIITEP